MSRLHTRLRSALVARRPGARGRGSVAAVLLLVGLALLPTIPARADLLPEPSVPPYGLYRDWLDATRHQPEGWIPGLHDRHWLPPESVPRGWGEYWVDELRLMPEVGLVLWIRRPAILDQFRTLSAGEDPYADQLFREWPEAVWRDVVPWERWFEQTLRDERLALVRASVKKTQGELAAEQARGSLIDLDVPVHFPKSVERVLGRGEKSNITVTGRETITFSGESTRHSAFARRFDESGKGQPLFPRLEMKQELKVKLSGTVGEKVHVEVENNSQAIGDAANRIRIRYEGDEDEVVELVEMGDTQLSLPSSGLISYSTQNKGLFGVKMKGHLGPLEVTAIASKQEAEVSSKTFSNSGQDIQSDFKRDIDFIANQFFFLDDPSGENFYNYKVDWGRLEVYISNGTVPPTTNDNAVNYFRALAYTDTGNDGLADDILEQDPQVQPFRRLQEGEFSYYEDANTDFYILKLNSPIQETEQLAVSYLGRGPNETELQVGDSFVGQGDYWSDDAATLNLELIKPDPFRPDDPTWFYMLRNVYRLGGRNLDFGSLKVEIERVSTSLDPTHPEGTTTPYLRFFGLDQFTGQEMQVFKPDNSIDRSAVVVADGLLLFPYFQPFNPPEELVCEWTSSLVDSTCESLEPDDLNPEIYTTDRETILHTPVLNNRFLIRYESATVASRFNLNAFDILEGSEVVTLDGRTLEKGKDYSIDYFSGEVQLLGATAAELNPASNLQVTYQYKPFIGGGKSSLLGMHGIYRLGEKNHLASSWLYESKHSGSRRPRLGEESTRNVVGNLLANFSANPEFLTRAANLLPLVDTDALSTASLSGELAVSFPNPNIDDVAYLDDMEGAEDADELGIGRTQWVWASEPADVIKVPGGADIPVEPANRARDFYWFHPQNTTRRSDFNLNLPEQEAQEVVDILQLSVPVNLSENQLSAFSRLTDTDTHNRNLGNGIWAGLMRGFPGQGLDLTEAEYLEIWVNDFQQEVGHRVGRLHFDMGTIDEDFWNPEDNEEDTEDPEKLGLFDELTMDTGLDGKFNSAEAVDTLFPSPYRTVSDPAGDDLDAGLRDDGYGNSYFRANGMEGNRRLDTEDLNGDGDLDQANSYFTFSVDLADSAFIDMVDEVNDETGSNPSGKKAWRLYRLNLDDARVITEGMSDPDWSRIRYFRFWVEGMNHPNQDATNPFNRLEIASIKLVGNRWKSHGIQEAASGLTLPPSGLGAGEDLRVEVINSKDNNNFTWPYGSEIDPDTGLPEREQALNVVYDQVQPGHQAVIRKDYQDLNLTGYRVLSFYIHPDADTVGQDLFLRAAQDSSEYYEWRFRPTVAGWSEVSLNLQDWTDLKLVSDADTVSAQVVDAKVSGRTYTLSRIGNPDLSRVRSIYFGVVNDEPDENLTGETWLNDLRVSGVKRATGFAGKLNASLSMAGVVNLNFILQEQDAEFRGLRATTGQGSHTRNWSVTGRTALQHFIPMWGYKLPISGSYGRNLSLPKYQLSSDVELDDAHREEQKSTSTSQQISGNLSRTPSQNIIGRILLDKLKLAGSVSQSKSRGPLGIDLREQLSYNISYDTQFKDRRLNLPFGARLRWLPNSLRMKSDVKRSRSESWKTSGGNYVHDPVNRTGRLTNSATIPWHFFDSFKTDFSINDSRELQHPDADVLKVFGKKLNIGFQMSQGQTLRIDYTLPFIRRFRPKVSFNSNYGQSSQNVTLGGSNLSSGSRNLTNGNSLSTNYNFQVGKWFSALGGERLKGFQARHAPDETEIRVPDGRSIPKQRARRLLVPVDPLRGPDPRMKKRRTRRWFDDELEVVVPEAAAVTDSTAGKVDPMSIVWFALDVLSDLKPLKVDLRRDASTQFNHTHGSPELLYRLGFSEDPKLPGTEGGQEVERKSVDLFTEMRTLKLATGVTIADNVSVSTNFDWSRNMRQQNTSHSLTTIRKWPNVSVDFSGVEKWPIWGNLFETSSFGFSYGKDMTIRENLSIGTRDRDEGINLSPRWSMTWANKMQTTLSGSYGRNDRIQNTSHTRDSRLSLDASWNHNLSAPNGLNIPGLRGLRFSSRMDLTAKIGLQRLRSVRIAAQGIETPQGGSTRLSISPGASYQFTEKLRGSANITYSRTSQELDSDVVSSLRLDLRTTFVF